MSPTLLIVMGLAAYRAWHLIGRDTWPPIAWARAHIGSKRYVAEEEGLRSAGAWGYIDDMIACPWCLGSLIAFGLVWAIDAAFVPLALPALQAAAVACIVGLIGSSLDG